MRSFSALVPMILGAAIAASGVAIRNASVPPEPGVVEPPPAAAAPIVKEAYDILIETEERHERRFREALDPAAAAKASADRLAEAFAAKDTKALAAIGFDLFLQDRQAPAPPKALAETTRCSSCHHKGGPGGSGGLIDNYYEGRNPTGLAGAALLERTAAEITKQLKAGSTSVQGISFTRGIDNDLVVRPFGRTGKWARLEDAVADMGRVTMGVDLAPAERAALTAYIASLPAPTFVAPDPVGAPDLNDAFFSGRRAFERVGCGNCHKPEWRLSDGTVVTAYTDFKRHDMGDALADGKTREWMTPPLWGLSMSAPWLHDGRALASLERAIALHDGEAKAVREAFQALPLDDQRAIRVFLLSLAPEPRMRIVGQ